MILEKSDYESLYRLVHKNFCDTPIDSPKFFELGDLKKKLKEAMIQVIDLPSEPQLIPGKEYTMRNGEKAYFLGVSPSKGKNVFEQQDVLWLYDGLAYFDSGGFHYRDYDIIIEPEKKEPRVIYINEYNDPTDPYGHPHDTLDKAKGAGDYIGSKYIRTIKFIECLD
jgi:hypothetical protein